ncbi:MAG: Tetratricopeptide 2 repeat protein [Rhodocyclales bacterium]|nr:Tetratricopeptide 2 repeat protein [Rhodocyclales bacterium]
MKTVVLQSFRRQDVPRWLTQCLQSVQRWAADREWDYEFLDDVFFEFAPQWVRKRCGGNIYAIADVCRLQWLRDKLDAGYERAVCVDADVLIFAPERLNISVSGGYAFAHELFMRLERDGTFTPVEHFNNALMIFEQAQSVLDTYFDACLKNLRDLPPGKVPRTALGPALFDTLGQESPLELLAGVGLFSLTIMKQIALGGGPLTQEYLRYSPAPLAAANLCHFMRNETPSGNRVRFDGIYGQAVDKLLESRGDVMRYPQDIRSRMTNNW